MKPTRRTLLIAVLVLVPLVLVGLFVYTGWVAYDAAVPEAPAADLKARRPVATRRVLDVREDDPDGCTLVVTAEDSHGRPVSDVEVFVAAEQFVGSLRVASDVTDDTGHVTFSGLECRRVSVSATHDDFALVREQRVRLKKAEPRTHTLTLQAGVEVAGQVLGPDGDGIGGATVTWSGVGGAFTTADSRGHYRLVVPAPQNSADQRFLHADAFGFRSVGPHTAVGLRHPDAARPLGRAGGHARGGP